MREEAFKSPSYVKGDILYRFLVLGALVVVYVLNNVDRHIMSILSVPIQKELHLTDTQVGLMGGTAFALFYSLLGVPIARLAYATSRTRIIEVLLSLRTDERRVGNAGV